MSETDALVQVGAKVKELREERGWELSELAEATGLSVSVVSQIENYMISPPLGTLIKVAKAFEVPVGTFFGSPGGDAFQIVRREERRPVSRFASKEGVNYGYGYESLAADARGRHMEPFIVTLEESQAGDPGLSSHDGEEFLYVLDGEVEVTIGKHSDRLEPGDSIYYNARLPHRVSGLGRGGARILAVIYPG